MPRHPDQALLPSRPGIGPLLQQLAGDSVRWANAELTLARTELLVMRRLCLGAAILATVGIAALLTALIILAETSVTALGGYLGSNIASGLAVAASLLVFAALCALATRWMFGWEAESLNFRWLTPSMDQKRLPQWTH
jgi:hypothetical protein